MVDFCTFVARIVSNEFLHFSEYFIKQKSNSCDVIKAAIIAVDWSVDDFFQQRCTEIQLKTVNMKL